MKTSEEGRALIQSFEQCRLRAYLPTPDDVWTCGWGSTQGVTEDTEWTQEEADARFEDDLAVYEKCVEESVDVELTQAKFDACVSLAFNIGRKAFKDSTLCRLLNAGDYEGAKAQFSRWNKQAGKVVNGLTRRRAAEAQMFGSG